MISYDLADRYIPEMTPRAWDKSLKLFPSYDINSTPESLGLARRVKTWLEDRVKNIALEELDEWSYTMRRARQVVYSAAEDKVIGDVEAETLIFMIRKITDERKQYMLQAIELIGNAMLPNLEPKSSGFMVLWPDQRGKQWQRWSHNGAVWQRY